MRDPHLYLVDWTATAARCRLATLLPPFFPCSSWTRTWPEPGSCFVRGDGGWTWGAEVVMRRSRSPLSHWERESERGCGAHDTGYGHAMGKEGESVFQDYC